MLPKILRYFSLAFIVFAGITIGANANASCFWMGQVKYYTTTATTATFYVSEASPTTSRYMLFTTTDHDWMRVMTTAQSARANVKIYGNASSCGSGTFGNGGSITSVDISHFY